MNDISLRSMDKLESLSTQAMKVIEDITRLEMKRTGHIMTDRDIYDNFKTFCLLYQSGIINKTITHANAILLGDGKTETKVK